MSLRILEYKIYNNFLPSLMLGSPLTGVWLSATLWTAAHQASLCFTVFWSLLKLMSIESMMPSNHLILCCPFLLLPSIFSSISGSFPISWLFTSGGQSIGTSASASVHLMNIQGWFLLELTALISLLSKGPSRVCSSTIVKESACNAGDLGLIPGSERSSWEGNGSPLQYSCLENSLDRGAWWAIVHGVTKSWAWPND